MSSYSHLSSQSIQSLLSSSMDQGMLGLYKLSEKDNKRLDEIYEKLSKDIIERRLRKINIMEQFDQVLNERDRVGSQIRRLQAEQMREVMDEKQKQQQKMLSILTKKQKAKQELKEATERYKKRQLLNEQQNDMSKGFEYLKLIKQRVEKEQQLQKLYSEQRHIALLQGCQSIDQVANKLTKQNQHQRYKSGKSALEELTPFELVGVSQKLESKEQRQRIKVKLRQIQYPQHSFTELSAYRQQQQSEKAQMFEDLLKMKSKLTKMQQQNIQLQNQLQMNH